MSVVRYAILQKDLVLPRVEALKRAFRSVKCLTDYDAFSLARDGFGILVKNLTSRDAATLQGALRVEGLDTDIVDQARLPVLPPSKQVHRLDCGSEALVIYDPLGRGFNLEWKHVMLVAAGGVPLREVQRVEMPGTLVFTSSEDVPSPEYRTKVETHVRLLIEIVVRGAVLRYVADAEKFNFQYLGERKTPESRTNFELLVRDLVRRAPHAAINQGACHVREAAPQLFSYPSKNAFYEEIVWLLYRLNSDA